MINIINSGSTTITGLTLSDNLGEYAFGTSTLTPLLTITKSVIPVPVAENGLLTYTFQIQNIGNTAADTDTGIVVTDTFDPILSNLTVTYNGTTLTEGTDYTYEETTGVFATVAGVIVVPAATYSQNPDTGGYTTEAGTGTLVVTGTV